MKVLGIDPGTHRIGWAVVEGTPSKQVALSHGCLEFPSKTPSSVYLPKIFDFFTSLIDEHDLDSVGMESLLFQKNVKTAISVAEARGVIELVAHQHHLTVHTLAPNTIKSAVAGHGGASKADVTRMVGLLLSIDAAKLIDDECDALAVAMTTIITNYLGSNNQELTTNN
jgi:crossover junction endodeoxyribonuclease RuvC